jgi:hypothetical protein
LRNSPPAAAQRVGDVSPGLLLCADRYRKHIVAGSHVLGMTAHVVEIIARHRLQDTNDEAAQAVLPGRDVEAARILRAVQDLALLRRHAGALKGVDRRLERLLVTKHPNDQLARIGKPLERSCIAHRNLHDRRLWDQRRQVADPSAHVTEVAGRSHLLPGGEFEDGDRDPEALADAVEQAALLPPGAVFGPERDQKVIG